MTTTPDKSAAYAVRLIAATNAAVRSAASIVGGAFSEPLSGALDAKRESAWCEYGWPSHLEFANFKHLYDRQGVAYGVTNLLRDKCWEDSPRLIEGEPAEIAQPATSWEKSVTAILRESRFFKAYAEADGMRMVGGWSGLLLQMADDSAQSKWDQPISGKPALLKVTPAWAGQLKPEIDSNGNVISWEYTEYIGTGDQSSQRRQFKIHPDRIVLVGDWRTGASMLKACYNAFVNLEKISGGSAESFLKNASRQVHLNFDKETDLTSIAQAYGVKIEELQEVFNETARRMNRGNDLVLATQGATAVPLVATVPDPKAHEEMNLREIAAGWRMPMKVIVGMQTGERASTEDIKDFNRRGQGRRVHVLTFDLDDAIKHLIRIKVLPAPGAGYYVHWSDLTQASGAEKLDLAAKMAEINSKMAGTGEPVVFTADEIREAAGKEAREDSEGGTPPASEALSEAEQAAARLAEAERQARRTA